MIWDHVLQGEYELGRLEQKRVKIYMPMENKTHMTVPISICEE